MNEFTPYDAAQYRALDADAFAQRRTQVIDLMSAETLPEGVTDEMLYAERDLILAEIERRNKVTELRNADLTAVTSGVAKVIATSEPEQKRSEIKEVGNYTDTPEYRRALANHITRQAPMPAEMIARAQAEYRAGQPISVTVADGYSNYTDPLGVPSLANGAVPLPLTFMQEVARDMKEYGGLDQKVSRTSIQGGVAVSEAELVGEAMWINDKQTSPWNPDDFETFTFSAWQLEYRVARSLLAQAMLTDNFTNNAADIASEFSRQLNAAVWDGNGSGKPTGIITDTRLIGSGSGASAVAPKATIIEVTKEDMDSWAFWASLQYKLNSAYRGRGEWIMSDSTFGGHVAVLRDDNNRPVANFMSRYDSLNDGFVPAINGRPVNLLDDAIGTDFDTAAVGDIFAAFGDLKHYTLNTQPGMPLTTLSWDDHDNNLHKTKVSMACDGRVTNPFGWMLLKKKASA